MLLAHSSGLPAYEKLFLKAHSRDDLLRAVFTTSLPQTPVLVQSTATSDSFCWDRVGTHRGRLHWYFLPARSFRSARHDQHDIQPSHGNARRNSAHCGRARRPTIAGHPPPTLPAPSAKESSKAKSKTKTRASSAASPGTPASSPPPKTWPASPTPCSIKDAPSCVLKPWRSLRVVNPSLPAHPEPSVGTRRPPLAIRKILWPPLLRTPGLHWYVTVD